VVSLNLIEQIATRHAVGLDRGVCARSGMSIAIQPRHVLTCQDSIAAFRIFRQSSVPRVKDARQPVLVFPQEDDSCSMPSGRGEPEAEFEQFARDYSIDSYPAGTDTDERLMVENGYVTPGALVAGCRPATTLFGAMGALGVIVTPADAAQIWSTGIIRWVVPQVARIKLRGSRPAGVAGQDLIGALRAFFGRGQVRGMAVEFHGDGAGELSVAERMSVAATATDWGALAAVFPFDVPLRNYLFARATCFDRGERPGRRYTLSRGWYAHRHVEQWFQERLEPDPYAHYATSLDLDLTTIPMHAA
jgi:homoaconitate hydratase